MFAFSAIVNVKKCLFLEVFLNLKPLKLYKYVFYSVEVYIMFRTWLMDSISKSIK